MMNVKHQSITKEQLELPKETIDTIKILQHLNKYPYRLKTELKIRF